MKIIVTSILMALVLASSAHAVRIKDLASFEGARENQLVGYGLVVGLNGTGDSDQARIQLQSISAMLERMGVSINPNLIKVKNVAAVMVTATLPPFAKQGNRLDVLVSSLGDAKSIAGGTLIMSPLKGADSQVYAVAQGSVLTNSFAFGGQAASAQKNHPTAGRIPAGALVERELPNTLAGKSQLRLNLAQADFTTASRMAGTINEKFGTAIASTADPGAVAIQIPEAYAGRMIDFISVVETLDVRPDTIAKVVLNERTGTIVMGEQVRISTVAVSHGNLSLVIKETPRVSQPAPLSTTGETKVVPRTELKVEEESRRLSVLSEGATIGDVVRALNTLGVTPRDLIGILQAIKAAGALQAELTII
ncbi:flagellar basal body P-ring protein FlgI [Geobacter sp. SVR]|uniref:flagellar basal body P-ring protein FlgI n=1 Tax=Geobacter sp. SVR TaxID=2495594 RepID=UPI00143F00CB|nr:flagellar basal body P-ring protein FlgI [Geobacter sp. SVR]BCS55802.1 flagellar P-ring protein [Geobacter sp. SVR]GCF83806.1 flagellar P-ring protein [Geobacter sp. SVR]